MHASSLTDLREYLHRHIPISAAMEVDVAEANTHRVILTAPLGPNLNHRQTAFGGSESTLCILSAWALLYTRLKADLSEIPRIVIHRNTMEYTRAVEADFAAESSLMAAGDWPLFLKRLHRKGMARIELQAALTCREHVAGHFSGEYVVMDTTHPRFMKQEAES